MLWRFCVKTPLGLGEVSKKRARPRCHHGVRRLGSSADASFSVADKLDFSQPDGACLSPGKSRQRGFLAPLQQKQVDLSSGSALGFILFTYKSV